MEVNIKNLSTFQFCVKIAVGDGICSFGGSATTGSRIRGCNLKYLGSSSSSPFMFRILPLELGLHTINFTLLTDGNSETVVKTLRVMVRKKFKMFRVFLNFVSIQSQEVQNI